MSHDDQGDRRLTGEPESRLTERMEGVEAAVLEGAPAGDLRDFRRMVEEHGRHMFRLAYRMTGNTQDAEDVVQETFLRAYRARNRYEASAQVSTWLHRIAANYAIDLMRRRKRWKTSDLEQTEQHSPLRSDAPGPEREAVGSDIERTVEKVMDTMTERERTAFTLRHYEGLPIAEIASVMGVRDGAVKNHVFRAVQKLRKALAPVVGRDPDPRRGGSSRGVRS